MSDPRRAPPAARNLTRAWSAPVRAVTRRIRPDSEAAPVGDPTGRESVIGCAVYVDGVRQPGEWHYQEALAAAREHPTGFVWLGLREPGADQMANVARAYGLHELSVEDAVTAGQRPKLEHFADVSVLAMRTIRYVEHEVLTENSEVVETGQVVLFIGPQFVISVRHGDTTHLAPIRSALETKPDLLAHGPWVVAYAVADHLVDRYIEVAERVADDLDLLEEQVFARQGQGPVQRIYQLKRELVEFRRAVFPLQRPLDALVAPTSDVPREVRRYFRDVHDHLSRTVEQITSFEELLGSILQARLAQVSVDQNQDMRKIAAWAAIAAVWTAIAGVYGMNFRHMPELGTRFGYPIVLGLMVTASVILYRQFRRAGWL
jgi:magnesium transporter